MSPALKREEPAAPAPVAAPRPAFSAEQESRRKEVMEAFVGLRAKNHFEVLGIPRASGEAQVKEAYFKLARRFHPDTHHDPALADLRDKIEAIFIRLGEAYEVLRDRNRRSSYESEMLTRIPRTSPQAPTEAATAAPDPEQETRAAEEAVRRAEKLYSQEKYWDSIQTLEPALAKLAGKPLQRARVLLARNYLKNPKWVKRAEEVLQGVVREDANNVDAHFLLATIYRTSGLKNRALHEFERVLALRPEHEEARVAILDVMPTAPTEPEEQAGAGLLKKLFGKS